MISSRSFKHPVSHPVGRAPSAPLLLSRALGDICAFSDITLNATVKKHSCKFILVFEAAL
jgi:hypothetical protein